MGKNRTLVDMYMENRPKDQIPRRHKKSKRGKKGKRREPESTHSSPLGPQRSPKQDECWVCGGLTPVVPLTCSGCVQDSLRDGELAEINAKLDKIVGFLSKGAFIKEIKDGSIPGTTDWPTERESS